MIYSKKELEDLRLDALREIGREVGVRAPSALKKKDLIYKIISVTSGTTLPHKPKSGRPCLKSHYIKAPNHTDQKVLSNKEIKVNNLIKHLQLVISDLNELMEITD